MPSASTRHKIQVHSPNNNAAKGATVWRTEGRKGCPPTTKSIYSSLFGGVVASLGFSVVVTSARGRQRAGSRINCAIFFRASVHVRRNRKGVGKVASGKGAQSTIGPGPRRRSTVTSLSGVVRAELSSYVVRPRTSTLIVRELSAQ